MSTTSPAPLMSYPPAQTHPENASNSTNEVTMIGPIWHFFQSSSVEIIQFITLIVLWAVAARIYPLGFFESCFPPLLTVGLVYIKVLSREKLLTEEFPEVERPEEASSTVKVTGYRLASSAMTLFLGIAKVSLSAVNKPGLSNYLDLVAIIVALSFLWIGHYSEVHDNLAPWFFQEDYGSSLGKGLRGLGRLCLAGILALLHVIVFDVLLILTGPSVVWVGDQEFRYMDEVRLETLIPLWLCQFPVFLLLLRGVVWGTGSGGLPRRVHSRPTMVMVQALTPIYILIILRMSLSIWRQSEPRLGYTQSDDI